MKEVWKPIKNYDGYEISTQGRIRSWIDNHRQRRQIPKIITPGYSASGYLRYCARNTKTGRRTSWYVHREVARAFLMHFEESLQVNHKDGNKANNNVTNLEMVTCQQNIRHAHAHHLTHPAKGERHGRAKVTQEQVRKIRQLKAQGVPTKQIAQTFGMERHNVWSICRKKTWKHID